MSNPISILTTLKNRRLSLRLLMAIGGCSLLFILLAIAFQLYVEYNRDIAGIESRLNFIENSYVPALTSSAYQLDEEQVRLLLRGVLQLQDIVAVQVREQLKNRTYDITVGDQEASGTIKRQYQLIYPAPKPVFVGTLLVNASLDGVYARLKERVLTIVVSNALLIVPLALAILLILQLAVNRHLIRMAQFARTLNLDTLDRNLTLQRPPGRLEEPDELDQLVHAINEMRLRIREDMHHRRDAEQELLFRKTMLECILEARVDGILITSEDNLCLFSNSHFSSLWRERIDCPSGAPAQPVWSRIEAQLKNPESFRSVLDEVRETPDTIVQGEIVLIASEILEYSTVPVKNQAGSRYGRLWSFRDVSQRKTLEEQLRQSQKLETLGNLAGGIAHDFNNLLLPITGYAELGLNRLEPGDPLFVDLNQILKAAGRATDLTRQILAFSRKQMLEVKNIDLNDLIRDFAGMVQRLIGENITVQTMLTPQPAIIRADRSQIEQVVLNMAINARDAMPVGGTLTIETTETFLDTSYAEQHVEVNTGHYVLLSISDTGVGMDTAVRDRIFEPFYTTKERGKGTGLGLATSFGIVKQHHGHLRVYSEPGYGTIFKIYIPKAEGLSLTPVEEEDTRPVAIGGEHILVVEDDTMVRELVCETLVANGYRITVAEDPKVAQELIAQTADIDLLLTDVVMPIMNGRELYQLLSNRIPGLKVLYMSGYTENVIANQGMLYEGVNFIQKPFSILALLQKVRQACDSTHS